VGASCLLLTSKADGRRVFLNVEAVEVCNPHARDFQNAVPAKFRARLVSYKKAVPPDILGGHFDYRFYFLNDEPWPEWLQKFTPQEHCPDLEWKAVLASWLDSRRFFEWPQVGTLLWPGCTRDKQNQCYPPKLEKRLARLSLQPDPRNNGPAIMAFLAAGGHRPIWGTEGWPIHHIYDGIGEGPNRPQKVLRAVDDGEHFTHSAGLVAVHPAAHHLAHQSDLLRWLLRREAFLRFGYDPTNAFSKP